LTESVDKLKFSKYHGLGNDFVIVDENGVFGDAVSLSRGICDRNFGVGADGVLFLGKSETPSMRVINSDGSQPEMCGNGLRVAASWMIENSWVTPPTFEIQTGAGVLEVSTLDSVNFRVNMGPAILNPKEIGMVSSVTSESFIGQQKGGGLKGTAVSMGNPHLVIFVSDFSKLELEKDGPLLENHPFFPSKTNVHFVQVANRTEMTQKTWERGAGATLACGTGACAAVVAAFEQGFVDSEVTVHLPGGDLQIAYDEKGLVWMTGPAKKVFDGEWLMPLSSYSE
jgi:diaminopimelate epimerase